jgi:hypothetical protein
LILFSRLLNLPEKMPYVASVTAVGFCSSQTVILAALHTTGPAVMLGSQISHSKASSVTAYCSLFAA